MSALNVRNRNSGVLVDGCFDPLHIGHVRYLLAAKALCIHDPRIDDVEPLMARVAPDAAVLAKGRSPFQTAGERADCLNAFVPCHCYFNDTLAGAVLELKPRLLVKGLDWHGALPRDVVDACISTGTHIVYTPTQERTSTERLAS